MPRIYNYKKEYCKDFEHIEPVIVKENSNRRKVIKRISHIILSLILLIATTGMTITGHYCGNRLVSVNILSEPDKCCDNNDCCRTETFAIKLDTDIINSSPEYSFRLLSSPAPLAHESIFNENFLLHNNSDTGVTGFFNLPPKLSILLSRLGTFLL